MPFANEMIQVAKNQCAEQTSVALPSCLSNVGGKNLLGIENTSNDLESAITNDTIEKDNHIGPPTQEVSDAETALEVTVNDETQAEDADLSLSKTIQANDHSEKSTDSTNESSNNSNTEMNGDGQKSSKFAYCNLSSFLIIPALDEEAVTNAKSAS